MIAIQKKKKAKGTAQPESKPKANLLPGGMYIRMSSSPQEKSPGVQREEIAPLVEQFGATVFKEYFDKGISGTSTKGRGDFEAMIADAEAGRFKILFLSEMDRFGRFDPYEQIYWLQRLRMAGCRIVSASKGELGFEGIANFVTNGIDAHTRREYVVSLSRKVTSGHISGAKAGRAQGSVPYAYDRLVKDESGKVIKRVAWHERFALPRGWSATRVISANKQAVATVRFLFDGISAGRRPHSLSRELTRKKAQPPQRGRRWRSGSVLSILRNPAYSGVQQYGRRGGRAAKFHAVGANEQIVEVGQPRGVIERDGVYEPIVSREQFDRVQDLLDLMRRHTKRRASGTYVLSGFVYCGHCGSRMTGHQQKGRRYTCSSSRDGCRAYSVKAEALEQYVMAQVLEMQCAPDRIEAAINAEMKARETSVRTKNDLKPQIASLERKIQRGVENLLLAAAVDIPEAKEVLARWRGELEELRTMAATDNKTSARKKGRQRPAATVVMARVDALKQHLASANPDLLRQVFAQTVNSVTLFFDKHKRGFQRGFLDLQG